MPKRDYACLLPAIDYDAQLQAIRSLLEQHKENENRRTEDIPKIDHEMSQLGGEQS